MRYDRSYVMGLAHVIYRRERGRLSWSDALRLVRRALGLEAGDRVEFVEQEKGQFAIVAATRSVQELKGLFQGKRSRPVSIEEMNAVIAKRASESR